MGGGGLIANRTQTRMTGRGKKKQSKAFSDNFIGPQQKREKNRDEKRLRVFTYILH